MNEQTERPGLRELHKQEKLRRIKGATSELFREKGFEATTIKEIAERAMVAPGTIFLYVKNKQDLLILIFYEGIETTVNRAFETLATLPEGTTLLDELLHIFGTLLRFYSGQTDLARAYVKELPFLDDKGYVQDSAEQIYRFLGRLAQRIELARQRGEISAELDIEQACQNFFGLYFATLVFWLSKPDDVENLIATQLKNSFELQIKGMLK